MGKTEVRGEQIKDATVSLTADVTGTLPADKGGTGNATNTLNNVLLGNGTGALQTVAPGSNGNVLTSNGTTWQSAAPGGGSSPLTTKGDLFGYAAANARIPVGSDGSILVADSGQALGVAYQNVGFMMRRNLQFNSNPGAITVSQFGYAAAPAIVAGAVTTQGDDTDGPFIQLNTTAVAANVSSVATAYTQFRREWDADVTFKIKLTALALTAGRIWVGLFSATPALLDLPLVHIAGFRLATTGAQGSANWRGITAAGTATQTNVDTGVVGAVSTAYTLRIQCIGSVVNFYVNGKYVGQSSTNLPTATTLLAAGVYCTALSTAATGLKFGWCSALQE